MTCSILSLRSFMRGSLLRCEAADELGRDRDVPQRPKRVGDAPETRAQDTDGAAEVCRGEKAR